VNTKPKKAKGFPGRISDVLTTTGGRSDGEALGGYALHSASAAWESDRWTLTLYAENLFNKFAKTDVSRNRRYVQSIDNYFGTPIADPVVFRGYTNSFVAPRQFGLRFSYDFDL